MKQRLLVLLILATTVLCGFALDHNNELLLDSLTTSLNKLESVRKEREQMLEDLKMLRRTLEDGQEKVIIGEKLGRNYLSTNIDSAVLYLRIAQKDALTANLPDDELRIRLELYSLMPAIGVTREAVESFNAVDYESVPQSLKKNYWLSSMELYNSLQMPYPKGQYKNYYIKKRNASLDSLINYYPQSSTVGRFLEAYKYMFDGETNLAVASLAEVLKDLNEHPDLKDDAMRIICDYYKEKPSQYQTYINMLARRVMYNLNNGMARPEALATLGELLIKENHGKLGRRCIRLAMETSDYSYAQPYTSFDRAHYARLASDEAVSLRRTSWIWIVLLALSCIAGCCAVWILRQKLKESRLAESELRSKLESQAASSQRTNLNLISLAFSAIEQSKDLHVHIFRKLKAGQVKDLYSELESGKYLQQEKDKYFTNFDSTFLSTFPDFIEKLNGLMLPGRQIPIPPAETLTPELRIAAFLKLGITDTARLSEALGLSVNTIYTYRNRLKSRLADKDHFEENLAAIL